MLSNGEIETCKEEARNYIEFMETAGDNAGWARGLMWYIEQLELGKEKIEKAKEDFRFFNEGDYITREMAESKAVILEQMEQLEKENIALKKRTK